MYVALRKRSISLNGLKTSVSLEDIFWDRLCAICKEKEISVSEIVSTIKADRKEIISLSGAIRVFVLQEALGARR